MKKTTLFVCLLLSVQSVVLAAGTLDGGTGVQARATALTRSISEKVRLDEGQYLRVKQLNMRMLLEIEDLKTRFAADQAILDQRLADAQIRYENDLTALLRPAQLALFQESRANMTALGQH
ncbi:hypothetical protein [Hymenobacter metallilatus]|uniref:OmpH family outer membrane protein n=1 Tax=Hymenobacter metallilatus TaxID=2493666 RepID=A0A3R9LVV6_9BACT|nr:hypothetical protein [Hymenobacter metallilatus]RSK25280.1 hypothetical protein EI290_17830 [Hymenobacter metallilatus]